MKKYYKMQENTKKIRRNLFDNFLYKFLSYILPVQNPDFEKILDDVEYWFIEFDNNIPVREIGFNSKNIIICKMPFGNNYGFWTDSNMELSDFFNNENFEIIPISEAIFHKNWKNFRTLLNA